VTRILFYILINNVRTFRNFVRKKIIFFILKLLQNFEEQNPMPLDYKDKEKYEDVRNRAFKLFCENAFWVELKLCEATIEKLNAAGMWHENWNSVAYVSQCIMRLNSWRIREMNEEQKQQQETTEGFEIIFF